MSRKAKTLIICLGGLLILGGAYYGSTVWQKKKAEASSSSYTPSPRLGNLESAELVKIEVPGLVLEKSGDVWELISLDGKSPPDGIELDQSQINSLTWSLASVWVESVIDEQPDDLSVYGLDKPSGKAIVTDSAGKEVTYIRGDMTPSRSGYYAMEEGDPKVYSLYSYSADNIGFTLNKIRNKSLFPAFEFHELARLRLEKAETRIDISAKGEQVPPYLSSSFSTHVITSPYRIIRGIDSQALYDLVTPLNSLGISEFVDDHPLSLSPYGLDKPVRLFLETNEVSIDLLIGNSSGGFRYAKLADAPGVFTVSSLDPIIDVSPFALVDKFALLVNIDNVNQLTISGGERPLSADFQGEGDDAVFFLNGKKAETKSFKTWYQSSIGLIADAEIPGPAPNENTGTGNITIEYRLNTPSGERTSITLVPFNRDFYALRQEGTMEFLVSRNQVRNIFETADAVVFE